VTHWNCKCHPSFPYAALSCSVIAVGLRMANTTGLKQPGSVSDPQSIIACLHRTTLNNPRPTVHNQRLRQKSCRKSIGVTRYSRPPYNRRLVAALSDGPEVFLPIQSSSIATRWTFRWYTMQIRVVTSRSSPHIHDKTARFLSFEGRFITRRLFTTRIACG
jgi:hypothetical protein